MLVMYAVYCVALSFNVKLERWAKSYNIPFLPKDDEPAEESALVSYRSLQEDRLSYTGPNSPVTEQMKNQEGNLVFLFILFWRIFFNIHERCIDFLRKWNSRNERAATAAAAAAVGTEAARILQGEGTWSQWSVAPRNANGR